MPPLDRILDVALPAIATVLLVWAMVRGGRDGMDTNPRDIGGYLPPPDFSNDFPTDGKGEEQT